MAQKTEKEETEFKVPETTLSLCVNNCGFTGSPATNNMCQKCFSAAASAGINFSASDPSRSGSMRSAVTRSETSPDLIGILKQNREDRTAVASDEVSKRAVTAKREVNRCSDCRKKVGLTGFRCRCGELFCGEHRYSDRHDCSYDYKSVGREAIARENPVVKAAKIVKI